MSLFMMNTLSGLHRHTRGQYWSLLIRIRSCRSTPRNT